MLLQGNRLYGEAGVGEITRILLDLTIRLRGIEGLHELQSSFGLSQTECVSHFEWISAVITRPVLVVEKCFSSKRKISETRSWHATVPMKSPLMSEYGIRVGSGKLD